MSKIINGQDKKVARGELKIAKKYCWIGGIVGAASLFLLLKFHFTGNAWLNGLVLFSFIMGANIYEREMRIIGYIKGYDDGYSAAKGEEGYLLNVDSVGYWGRVKI